MPSIIIYISLIKKSPFIALQVGMKTVSSKICFSEVTFSYSFGKKKIAILVGKSFVNILAGKLNSMVTSYGNTGVNKVQLVLKYVTYVA